MFATDGFYPKNSRFGYYAWNFPEFRAWFQPEYNPGIDPTKIRRWDQKTILYHLEEDGRLRPTTAHNLFTKNAWNKIKVHSVCWSYKKFREWFQPENNPGVDPKTLRTDDNEVILIHVHKNGWVQKIKAISLFAGKDDIWYPKRSQGSCLAWDYPKFRVWFQQEYNPGIDPTTIRKWDSNTRLFHMYEDGVLRSTTAHSLFERDSFDFKGYFVCWDYPLFRKWFQPEYNPGVDPKTLRRNDTDVKLVHVHENGWVQKITACSLITTQAWYPKKSRKQDWNDRSTVRMINAVDMDEDIAIFLPKAEDKVKALKCMSNEIFEFTCPLCGNVFSNEIRRMIAITPKCPACFDTGFIEDNEDNIVGAYLSFYRRKTK